MEVEPALALGTVTLAILLTALAAAAEMSLASLSRARLKQLMADGISPALRITELLATPGRFLTTLLQLKILAIIAAASAVAWWAFNHQFGMASLLFAQLVMFVLLVLTQTVARALVVGNPEPVALRLVTPLHWLTLLMSPLTWFYLRVATSLHAESERAADESIFLSEDGLRFLINVSEGESLIEEGEKEMIASIFELGDTLVREVMVPRIDLIALDERTPVNESLDVILEAGHSRIPVYRDSIDSIVGVLYAKDLLRYFREGQQDIGLLSLVREPYFVPESKPVDELLRELQLRRVHMAIIVDEYGGTAGVVTIEDLLEEIVGDIQDEYDLEEPEIQQLGTREYVFSARISLDEVNDLLAVELPNEGGDTLGGFIYSQLGKVPVVDDEVAYGAVKMQVLSVEGNRIDRVRAWIEAPTPQEPPETTPPQPARGESVAKGSLLSLFILH